LAALGDENEYVRSLAAKALGEVKVGAPEAVGGLLAALRDEEEYVRTLVVVTLGELSKDRKSRLPQELSHQVAYALRDMLNDPRNQDSKYFFAVGERAVKKSIDAIWEALWSMCQRMDEQQG
jgi:hypothetical protein